MNHKTAVKVAILMLIVFGAITILYPRIFSPKAPVDEPIDAGAPSVDGPPPTGP